MASKTLRQKQRRKLREGMPPQVPSQKKPVLEKKTRPNMKSKNKIRLGLASPDIYEGFDQQKGTQWICPKCGRQGRAVGFCLTCDAEVRRAAANALSRGPHDFPKNPKKSAQAKGFKRRSTS